MPTFEMHQRGTIRGIPRVGAKKQFLPGDTYTPTDGQEIAILRGRPDYVAEEISGEGDSIEQVIPVESVDETPPEPTQLELAQAKQAFRDKLTAIPQNALKLEKFADGSEYKTVWKYAMRKAEFIGLIMEKTYG